MGFQDNLKRVETWKSIPPSPPVKTTKTLINNVIFRHVPHQSIFLYNIQKSNPFILTSRTTKYTEVIMTKN